ncbi:TAF RNA polymerase I subunit A [Melia azedarach]|uniref:TAF RNA polymerase I subunit A n=1 Tax=Melia azedarach TaxID=155640 RepID=A0ACC1WU63_MELAZ|nr:TAF RNA polymerase I subunit A [Melia azedarach]
MKMSEHHAVTFEDAAAKEPKSRKRGLSVMRDEDHIQIPEKLHKSIVLSLTKPSYLLGLGSKNLRLENRNRLCYLLHKLVRQRNWVNASGVLSMLLKGTTKEKRPTVNRLKYLVSMELFDHLESDCINSIRIKNVYDIWMKRIGSIKESPEDKFVVHLEFVIFCLTRGDVKEAHQAAMSRMQEREFRGHPMSNMVTALTFCERWHSSIPTEMKWKDSDQIYSPMHCDFSGAKLSHHGGNSGSFDTVCSHEDETHLRNDSDTSVMIGKRVFMEIGNDLSKEGPIEDHVYLAAENIQPLSSVENEVSSLNDVGPVNFASLIDALDGLDSWLLPIKLPKSYEDYDNFLKKHGKLLNDDYKNAMKYLRLALYSTSPVLSALLPFIQLLLVGGHVDEALKELDRFCHNSQTDIPFRLRASLLECFDRNNHGMLTNCFEDILKKDPTCSDSLAKLMHMHQNGYYSTESLVEMIALHLDATYADSNTWREFALCFLKLSQSEEDRMSVCLDGNEGVKKQQFSVCYKKIPNILTEGNSGQNWMLRCRWWLNRHFSKKKLASDIAAGDIQMLTYKAACASHMYGQEFNYVVKAYTNLDKEKDRDLCLFLKMHMQNSIRLYSDHLRKT